MKARKSGLLRIGKDLSLVTTVSPTVNLKTDHGPLQGTLPYRRHLQCRAGMFPSSNEPDRYARGATQAGEVPAEGPNEVCPTRTGQTVLSRSSTPTLLGLGSLTRKNNVDSETVEGTG